MQLLAGTDVGTRVRGHVRVWGGNSAVQPHSMGGVIGGRRGTDDAQRDTHTHTEEHTHTGAYTQMLYLPFSDLPLKKCPIGVRQREAILAFWWFSLLLSKSCQGNLGGKQRFPRILRKLWSPAGIRSRPCKPNQRKGQNEKFMNFAHFCEFWCFSLGKQARFTLNFCSGMPLRKVHELTFLWFCLPGPLLKEGSAEQVHIANQEGKSAQRGSF